MISKKKYDEFMCIGGCCEVGIIIQKLELSLVSYPFDWTLVKCFGDVTKAIQNDFKQYENIHTEYDPDWKKEMYRVDTLDIWLPSYKGNYQSMVDKFNTFRKLMKTNKRVLFIYKSHINNVPTPDEIQLFIDTIKKISTITFDILVVTEYYLGNKPISGYPEENCFVRNIFGHLHGEATEKVQFVIQCGLWNSPQAETIWRSYFTD